MTRSVLHSRRQCFNHVGRCPTIMSMITLTEVGKRYGELWAVRKLSLQVDKGSRVALIGPSGCGKSTLLRIIMGLIRADEGEVIVAGESIRDSSSRDLRHRMGYMVQGGGLFPHLTVLGNVSLVADYLSWTATRIRERYNELAQLVHLPDDFESRFPAELSGGQQQRVALMRALFLDPELVLLDEPMGALDPLIRADLQHELREIFESLGKTMLLVTHDISEAGFLGDEMVLLKEGQIEQQGSLAELVQQPASDFVSRFISAQRSPLESIESAS